jgi:hypothetical protein
LRVWASERLKSFADLGVDQCIKVFRFRGTDGFILRDCHMDKGSAEFEAI